MPGEDGGAETGAPKMQIRRGGNLVGNKKTDIRKRITFVTIGAALLAVILLFSVFAFSYIKKFDQTIKEENQAHLAEVADHIVSYIQNVVQDTQVSLETAGNALLAIPEDRRLPYLQDMAKRHKFAYVGYAEADGMLWATEASRDGDISHEAYFQSAMKGESKISGLVRHILTNRAVSGIMMSVPFKDGSGKPAGVLVAMLEASRLQEVLGIESYGGEGYSYIIDTEGNLVLHNKSMDYNNFFRVLQNAKIKEGASLSRTEADMRAGKSGMILYEQLGTSRYAYYCPLGMNGWTVVNIVSKEAITAKTDLLTRELAAISVAAGIVFLALLAAAAVLWAVSQSQRHAAETKSEFLANISHEIRTPMNAIVGMGELLMRSALNEKQKEYVRSILNLGKGLLAIINDVLDFSKIESGKFTIQSEAYKPEEILYDLMYMAAIKLEDKPVRFLIDVDRSVPACLTGDATRVRQILVNLVGNAVKFTEKGYIRLTIRCRREGDRTRVTMKVEDTGIGIRKQDMDKLFISFSQIDSKYSRSGEGTGLGLVITGALCRMMDGEIWVESEYGKGSVFTASIMQRDGGGRPLMEQEYPKDKGVLILDEEPFMEEYYAGCLNCMQVPYKICAVYEEFQQELESGRYPYAMADRNTVLGLAHRKVPEGVFVITLLKIQEHTLMSEQAQDLTVFVPLFGIQCPALLKKLAETGPASGAAPSPDSLSGYPYTRVLLVDDNALNLEIAEELMKPYGMQVDCVHSGQEAVDAVLARTYDLVFMDHMMPGMDGTEALKKIRTLPDQRGRSVPVVALTANASSSAQAMFQAQGFSGFLAKPIMIQKLNEILEKWLAPVNDRRRAEQHGLHEESHGSC